MLKWLSTTPNEGQTQTKTSNPNHKDEDTLAEHSERVSLDEQVPLTENSEEIGRDSSASEKVKFLAEANQPRNIKFLRHSAGKQNRSFQPAWFDKFPWLHYDEQSDSVLCFTCIKALHLKMISSRKGEAAFTETGFRNWKNGLARNKGFHKHESSECHREATGRLILIPSTSNKGGIGELISSQYAAEKYKNRQILLKILQNVRYLGKQLLLTEDDYICICVF